MSSARARSGSCDLERPNRRWRKSLIAVVGATTVWSVLAMDLVAAQQPSPDRPPAVEIKADSDPLPVSEPRDLAGELSVDVPMPEAELPPGAVVDEKRVDELKQHRSEGSETWTLESGRNVTEFFTTPKWFRGGAGEWAEVDPRLVRSGGAAVAGVKASVEASGVGFSVALVGSSAR